MIVYKKNFHHTQKLQKRSHNKAMKPKGYASGNKIWLNNKYIKKKQNRKLEAKFFGPFQILHQVKNQAYKLELSKKWKIHNIFYVSFLEHDTISKGQMDETTTQFKFELSDNGKEYKVKAICNSTVYVKESERH